MKDSEIIKKCEELVKEFLGLLKVDAGVKVAMGTDDSDNRLLKVGIEGDELGLLIGYRGKTLSSIQLILAQMMTNQIGEMITILVDVNDYREKRARYLKSLALQAVQEAKESGQNVELPPLSPYERRIIHIELKEEKGISTESEGEGEDRHIVVKVNKK
ncbi:KH domain-containing protein [Candidatus Dojkabacteria bacterium]|nr:KH domain-containing protein [Candidatus Dojkabacteria bacterium]